MSTMQIHCLQIGISSITVTCASFIAGWVHFYCLLFGGQFTVDNETGIILKAKLIIDEEYYEEFEVNELLFDDDAELPENGEYIKNRIAGCAPVSDPSSYDLSIID